MKKLLLLLFLFFFSSCKLVTVFKLRDAVQAESIEKRVFKQTIPFREVNGMIVVQVKIGDKTEDFILDTGAMTHIDDDLMQKIKYTTIGKVKAFDSNKTKKNIKYVKLKDIKVGEVTFLSMVAAVSDIDALSKNTCTEIKGILGVNVMKQSIWQIDYQHQKIIFTDDIDSLSFSKDKQTIPFYYEGKGVPKVRLSVNNTYIDEAILDTGSNGSFDFPSNKCSDTTRYVLRYKTNTALFGTSSSVAKISKQANITLGQNFNISPQICTYSDISHTLIGNDFLRNYTVTIDWQRQEITFSDYRPQHEEVHKSLGFSPRYMGGKIIVGGIYPSSQAYKNGLRLGDELLKINDWELSQATSQTYCELSQAQFPQKITINVKRDISIFEIVIEKADMLESIR